MTDLCLWMMINFMITVNLHLICCFAECAKYCLFLENSRVQHECVYSMFQFQGLTDSDWHCWPLRWSLVV
jgi:hypothetical protein